jgi:hypothetical protein
METTNESTKESTDEPNKKIINEYGRYTYCFDIEGTGQSHPINPTLRIGVVLSDCKTSEVIDSIDVFVMPPEGLDKMKVEARCLKWWKKPENKEIMDITWEGVKSKGIPLSEAMKKIIDWKNLHGKDILKNSIVISDHPSYDLGIMNTNLALCGFKGLSYFTGEYNPILDVDSFIMGVAGLTPGDELLDDNGNIKTLEEIAAMKICPDYTTIKEDNPYKHDHSPVSDASHISWNYMKIKSLLSEQRKTNIEQGKKNKLINNK